MPSVDPPHRPSPPSGLRRRLRRIDARPVAPLTTLTAGLVSGAAGAAAKGSGAALGAAVATVVTLAFVWTGGIPLLLMGADMTRAGLGYLVLMMTYALRLVALLVAFSVAARSDHVDVRWAALTLIACTLVWVGTQVALVGRSRPVL